MMKFKILGPLEVSNEGTICTPTPPKVRRVLALLLLRANQVVSTDALIEELWGEEPPQSAITTAQTYIYQLRRAFGRAEVTEGRSNWLVTTAPGYLMHVNPGQVDAHDFETLSWQGRQLLDNGKTEDAADVLREALNMWRGPALANVLTGRLLESHAVHLEEERLRTLELRILADAELGRHHALIGELRSLVATYPLNEWFHGQLIAALSRSGRRSEALQAYQNLRQLLRDELGLDPQPELQRLQQEVLSYDSPEAPLFGLRLHPALAAAS
jgi:SARP family transcriptional regulator, regulator of embCAB operon